MPDISIKVRNKIVQSVGIHEIVCGNSDYTISFDLDSEWNEFTDIVARFVYCDRNGVRHWIDSEIQDSICNVPVLCGIDSVNIGIYAGEGNIHTSTPSTIPCIRSITCILGQAHSMKRDFFNECMELLTYRNDPEQFKAAYNSLVEYWNNVIIQ